MLPESSTELYGCGWSTVSMGAEEMALLRARVEAEHGSHVLVSSCQRLEAFGTSPCDCGASEKWSGRDAVVRIATVAAGLDSAVLGEEQILGQVRSAFAEADGAVQRLAGLAIAAARELRRKTAFDSHAGHLLDRGLSLAGLEAGGALLVLGTGAMGRLVAARGVDVGFAPVFIAGRSQPTDAREHGWNFVPLEAVAELAPVNVVAGCLGSAAGEFSLEQLPWARLLLDLGTPRNFPANEGVITIAAIIRDEARRPHAFRRRNELRRELETILERRLQGRGMDRASLVGTLRRDVEEVRQRELQRMRRLHPEVAEDLLDAFSRSLVDQLFHLPSARLREMDDVQLGEELVKLFRPA